MSSTSTTPRSDYQLAPQSGWYQLTPITRLQKQLIAIEQIQESIKFIKKNLESEAARSFIAKINEIQDAIDEVLEEASDSIENLQSQVFILEEIEIETAEIEERYFENV